MQQEIQSKANNHAAHVWVPYATAGGVFVLHTIAAVLEKNILMVVGGQILALVVFLPMRMAFPRPTDNAR